MGKCCSTQKPQNQAKREESYIKKPDSANEIIQKGENQGDQTNPNGGADQISTNQTSPSIQTSDSNKVQLQVQAQSIIQKPEQQITPQSQQLPVQPYINVKPPKVDPDKLECFFKQKYLEQQQSFLCPICACQYEQEKICHLNCSHSFCDSCFYEFMKNQIKESKVKNDQMNCPSGQCQQYIHPNQINYILQLNNDQEMFKKYQQFSVKVADIQENEKLIECPTCQQMFIIYGPQEGVNCPGCQANFCPKCFKEPH